MLWFDRFAYQAHKHHLSYFYVINFVTLCASQRYHGIEIQSKYLVWSATIISKGLKDFFHCRIGITSAAASRHTKLNWDKSTSETKNKKRKKNQVRPPYVVALYRENNSVIKYSIKPWSYRALLFSLAFHHQVKYTASSNMKAKIYNQSIKSKIIILVNFLL